ncbi:MAG TPA: hypothetical protein VI542_11405 [Candidatus Tectomicrobia bacterium]
MNVVHGPTLFAAQLMRETLRSERLRATMLASVGTVIGLTLFLLSRLDASEFLTALRHTQTEYAMLGLIGGLVLYELGLRHMLGRFLQNNRRAPLPLRYVNAWLETTMPTIAIILFAQRFEPMYTLTNQAADTEGTDTVQSYVRFVVTTSPGRRRTVCSRRLRKATDEGL